MYYPNIFSRYADSGTMLEIRDIEYTPDGRSIVNTVGSRRFKIVSKGVKDGYNTAAVEFLQVCDGYVCQSQVTIIINVSSKCLPHSWLYSYWIYFSRHKLYLSLVSSC